MPVIKLIYSSSAFLIMLLWMLACGLSALPISPSAEPSAPGQPAAIVLPTITGNSRWMDYEKALAGAMLAGETYPPGNTCNGLCEWTLIGKKGDEVYVYALCQVAVSAEGTAMSAPAVLYLGADGKIEKVALPKDGSEYAPSIKGFFPPEFQTCALNGICFNGRVAMQHIEQRRQNPSIPPLIVEQGVTLP